MNNSDFNIDDILKEFSSDSPASPNKVSVPRRTAPAVPEVKVSAPKAQQKERLVSDSSVSSVLPDASANSNVSRRRASSPSPSEQAPAHPRSVRAENERADSPEKPKTSLPREISPEARTNPLLTVLFALLFLVITLFAGRWIVLNVHPNSQTAKTKTEELVADVSPRFSSLVNNLASDAMSDVVYIRKVYTIPEDANAGPVPNSSCFGETSDPQEVLTVISEAAELLDGQDTVWKPDTELLPGSTIKYYRDDTILSIVWKEPVNGTVFTFAEIKIADASQLRRCLAGDAYGSSIQLTASDMARSVNAVTAMNGDFYAFRQQGIVVYKRKLERFNPGRLDSCFFTASGELLFTHMDELQSEEQTIRFIEDNDILFSTSFGPILVENGVKNHTEGYAIGEIFEKYARSAIGTTGQFHYLLVTTSTEKGMYVPGVTVAFMEDMMYNKGCNMAYELDGGQTAVMIHNGQLVNEVVFGSERTMSDILYFATAIPEGEG